MTRRLVTLAALALLAAPALPAQQGPSVTLFNTGQVLVRRTLPLALPAGLSTHPLALGAFDPSSLTALDAGVQVHGIRHDPAWNEEAILRRHVGREFWFRETTGRPAFRATLVAMDPERWRLPDSPPLASGVVFGRPGQLVWPAELVPAAPVTDVTFRAARAAESVRVLYQAMGGSWSASYRLFVGGGARVEGTATIQAGPFALAGAEVQLLAGDVGMKAMPRGPVPQMAMAREAAADFGGAPSQEAVGEARLYTLPQRVDFTPGTLLALPLFDPVAVRAERRYAVGGALQFYGGFGQEPDEVEVPVEVTWHLDRAAGTPFGDLPLPAGAVSVFEADRAGRAQLVGQGMIGHTAPAEPLSVRTGTAFDVTARRTQTAFSTTRTPSPSRTIAVASYRVELRNAKDSSVVVEVREDRGGEWSVTASSVPAQRRASSRVVFPVTVPAKGSATLTYTVRVVW